MPNYWIPLRRSTYIEEAMIPKITTLLLLTAIAVQAVFGGYAEYGIYLPRGWTPARSYLKW